MGQRANYILIEGNQQTIFYNHWRANCIAADLYLGKRQFLDFVRKCQPVDVLLDEVWIEGCVVIKIEKKQIYFWSLELGYNSAVELYLDRLKRKWDDWDITHLKNKMYDIEEILGIEYTSRMKQLQFDSPTAQELIDDEADGWVMATIVIKLDAELHIVQTRKIGVEEILSFGQNVTEVLLKKSSRELYRETEIDFYKNLIIDVVNKKVIIDESEFGLLEQIKAKWEDYEFVMGDFSYIGALKLAGIDTTGLEMSLLEIENSFLQIIEQNNDFDPHLFAKELIKTEKDVKFNVDFFDTTRPSINFFTKIKNALRRYLNRIRASKS